MQMEKQIQRNRLTSFSQIYMARFPQNQTLGKDLDAGGLFGKVGET